MFTDRSYPAVGFPSQTSTDKSRSTADVQTDKIPCRESGSQSIELKDAETQTVTRNKRMPDVNYDKLAAFLKRVTPSVLSELDEIHGSTAFDGYDPRGGGEAAVGVKLLAKFETLDETDTEKKVSCVSWSAGGGTLALSYSAISHDTWCNHLTKIKLYNLAKEDQLSTASNKNLELNACATALAYHPLEPSILAAGLFNGDVLVWNLRDDESLSPLQVCVHGDSLSVVTWRPKSVNNVSPLVTASRDGYIFVHKLTASFTTVDLHRRFKIRKEHNPSEKTRPRSAGGRRERAVEPGLAVTTLDFSAKDRDTFVVGTLCGGLYKCNVDRTNPIEGSGDTFDPVVDEFERHQGSVTSVIFSPTHDTFVTSGTDKEIRVYDLSQYNYQHVIGVEDTAIGLSWLVGNSDIFAAYGAGQTVAFYNFKNGKTVPDLLLETNGKEASSLQFNNQRDLAAIGDTIGNLEIWKIPRNIVG